MLWVVNRLQNHAAPTFQLAVSVLQVFCEVGSRCNSQECMLLMVAACMPWPL